MAEELTTASRVATVGAVVLTVAAVWWFGIGPRRIQPRESPVAAGAKFSKKDHPESGFIPEDRATATKTPAENPKTPPVAADVPKPVPPLPSPNEPAVTKPVAPKPAPAAEAWMASRRIQ